jgi:hypothetical protein
LLLAWTAASRWIRPASVPVPRRLSVLTLDCPG